MVVHPPPDDPPRSFEPERRFSAPRVEWDATRLVYPTHDICHINIDSAPPPAQSQPEAANFPDNVYEMSKDMEFFKPPTAYPAPPTDMYYETPKEKPKVNERPQAIFPWEANQLPASRVFPDEPPLPPVPDPDHQPAPLPTLDTSGTEISQNDTGIPSVEPDSSLPPFITNARTGSQDLRSYSRTNAWDLIPSIQRYAEVWRTRRSRKTTLAMALNGITQREESSDRRPSLILTDFPTEVERPSLPVTPAPIRAGGIFWGREQPTEDLPQAEGVPSPEAWDPGTRLEELQRRQSAVFLAGPVTTRVLPSREQISSTIPAAIKEDPETQQSQIEAIASPEETPSLSPTVSGEDYEIQQRDSEAPYLRQEIFDITRATTIEDAGAGRKDFKASTVVCEPSTVKDANSEASTADMDEPVSPLTEETDR